MPAETTVKQIEDAFREFTSREVRHAFLILKLYLKLHIGKQKSIA